MDATASRPYPQQWHAGRQCRQRLSDRRLDAALIALRAQVVLRRGVETRTIRWKTLRRIQKQSRQAGEWIEAVLLPPRPVPSQG